MSFPAKAPMILCLSLSLGLWLSAPAAADCYSDSECGGGKCRNGKCTTAGGQCYSDSECPGGKCRNNKCTTAAG